MARLALALVAASHAFTAPARRVVAPARRRSPAALRAAPAMVAEPLVSQLASSSVLLSELVESTPVDKSGWCITLIHGVVGSYGVAIVLFTLLLKAVTFPLNYQQIESTTKMQALQPAIKRIQAKFPSSSRYRSLLSLAKEDLLEESFLWIPNLEGPVYGAQNADWLFKFDQWNGAIPPLGWHDTVAYLALPCLLVVAQSASTTLLQPPADPNNEAAQTSNQVLKYLPLMVGFFSLNVPAGLTIYWFCNNIITTASTLYIRQTVMAEQPVTMGGASVAAATAAAPKKPKKKKKEAASFDDMVAAVPKPKAAPDVMQAAPVVDAEIVGVAEPVAVADIAGGRGRPRRPPNKHP
ncbi:membrane insertase [Aureococcus anophagefferens]|nr:membrane insertase [Aureococcus anophagefferens]